jgi:hypothetical protein
VRFDFDTWLMQTYGMKVKDLDKKALSLAKKEYAEEYPKPGESEMTLKTYLQEVSRFDEERLPKIVELCHRVFLGKVYSLGQPNC